MLAQVPNRVTLGKNEKNQIFFAKNIQIRKYIK